jgi:predicted HAD superfamily hydrolase
MTSDAEQLSNLPWLADILYRPIKNALNIKIDKFFSQESGEHGFSKKTFFNFSGIKCSDAQIQFSFEFAKINEKSIQYLSVFISRDTLIIGYELSLSTRELLDKHGYTYVDIWLHPIRFLDDILFAFSSNNSKIFQKLKKFNIDESVYYLYADRFKISTYKGFKRYNSLRLKENSALFIGQTMEDKAILKDGIMLNITHFAQRMSDLAKQYSIIYYSRHPFAKNDENVMKYISANPSISTINDPAYVLLAQKEIIKVISISSSVALEAKYFDKDVEFLYKPVIDFSKKRGLEAYITVLQDFISPHFWSHILSPVMNVNTCKEVKFFVQKDKLRDMLGFYWSYKVVDKTEQMRTTLLAVDKKVQMMDLPQVQNSNDTAAATQKIKRVLPKTFYENSKAKIAEIKSLIDLVSIVSFDIFDTLLIRDLEKPENIFDIMEKPVEKMTKGVISNNFKQTRINAKNLVVDGKCGEEVSLQERYDAIAKHLGVQNAVTNKIMQLELELELKFLRKREFVFELFTYALENQKRVMLISDTFFSKEFIESVLKKNEISGYSELFISSDIGLLKHSGMIFRYIADKLKISPDQILHIGDNVYSDIEQAKKIGIKTSYIPRAVDFFKEKSGLDRALSFEDKQSAYLIKGLIGNKIMNNPFSYSYPSHSGSSKGKFGYSMAGVMFFAFAKWILEQSKQQGYKKIYFLARDGDIIKKCYDIVAKDVEKAPKSYYLLASRRAFSIPAIQNTEHIIELININFSPVPLNELLINRFGIEPKKISKKSLIESGFDNISQEISFNKHKENLHKLLLSNSDIIFEQASKERVVMLKYLASQGLDENTYTAIVDVGHNGMLQKKLSQLLNNKNINGFYFVTHNGIKENIYDFGMSAKAFVGDNINSKDKRYPYNKFILMFESIFLNKDGSLISLSENSRGQIVQNKLPVHNEKTRIEFIDEVQDGIMDFVHDAYKLEKLINIDIKIAGRESINPYLAMLQYPYELDVLMFDRVNFENVYSSRNSSYLIYYDKYNREFSEKNSLWKEGIEVCAFEDILQIKQLSPVQKVIYWSVTFIYKIKILKHNKYIKFKANPRRFFSDSKFKFFHKFCKYF